MWPFSLVKLPDLTSRIKDNKVNHVTFIISEFHNSWLYSEKFIVCHIKSDKCADFGHSSRKSSKILPALLLFLSKQSDFHVQQTTECSCRKLLLSFISFDVFTSCCLACQITFLKRHKAEANQTGCMFAICDVTPYVQQVSNVDWMVMVSSNPTVVKI